MRDRNGLTSEDCRSQRSIEGMLDIGEMVMVSKHLSASDLTVRDGHLKCINLHTLEVLQKTVTIGSTARRGAMASLGQSVTTRFQQSLK
eukprot:scaffold735_cov116-Cylindrotheca_fusiformis.AAC.13